MNLWKTAHRLFVFLAILLAPSLLPARDVDRTPGLRKLTRDCYVYLRETRTELGNHRRVLIDVHEAVKAQVKKGAAEDETLAAVDLPQFKKFKGYQRALEIAVRRIYRELTGKLP